MTAKARRRARRAGLLGVIEAAGTIVLGGGATTTGNAQRTPRVIPAAVLPPASNVAGGSKIIVSNLPYHVVEADLKELFSGHIGPLKRVVINFDASGSSRGAAEVTFRGDTDADLAYQRLNNVQLDGRPMKIEIVLQSSQIRPGGVVPSRSLRSSLRHGRGGVNRLASRNMLARPLGHMEHNGKVKKLMVMRRRWKLKPFLGEVAEARRPAYWRPLKTVEELDAELTAYMSAAMPVVLNEDVEM